MILLEKRQILTPLQKLPQNVGYLGKLIVAKGFTKLPKEQKIAQSGHTAAKQQQLIPKDYYEMPYSKYGRNFEQNFCPACDQIG